jgi:hypothetical protein
MMGDVVPKGKFPQPILMEFSWIMKLQRAWGVLSSTLWVPDWEYFERGQKCHASSTLNEVKREHGVEKQYSDLKILYGHSHTSGWRQESEGLSESGYVSCPIKKDLVVMSQWAHCPWTLESPEAAPAWPVAIAAQPAKQKEARGRFSYLVWKTSHLRGP